VNGGETHRVVAIDGPSGAGKSTIARRLAERLGVPYLDTGAMYRALALAALDRGIDPEDREAVEALAEGADIRLAPEGDGSYHVLLDGVPVEARIRTPEVGLASSAVSAHPGVRARMVALQRATAERLGGVLEGRDIGTRVFPDARYKFFLDADPEIRAERRHAQLVDSGRDVPRAEVEADLAERDRRDRSRADSPLTCDESYIRIDATGLGIDQVLEKMLAALG
jgi:cytidylate kinase